MKTSPSDTIWRLRVDLVSAKALLFVGSSAAEEEIEPDVHLFFYDRYWRLATLYEKAGRRRRAAKLRARAEHHLSFCPRGGPPYAAASAAQVPRPSIRTLARGRWTPADSDDAA